MAAALPVAMALSIAMQLGYVKDSDTVLTFACQESGNRPCTVLDPLAINDNTASSLPYGRPATAQAAERIADQLISMGHNIDLGVMQVNSANLQKYGLSVHDAFVPKRNMEVGARILMDAYLKICGGRRAHTVEEQSAALRCAASIYNTGSRSLRGARYAASIWRTAAETLPSIRELLAANFPNAAPGTDTTVTATRQSIDGTRDAPCPVDDRPGWHTSVLASTCRASPSGNSWHTTPTPRNDMQ